MFPGYSEVRIRRQFSFALGGQPFVLFRPSTYYMRPTNILEGNLLYPEFSSQFKYKSYSKTPSKLTHEIKYCPYIK